MGGTDGTSGTDGTWGADAPGERRGGEEKAARRGRLAPPGAAGSRTPQGGGREMEWGNRVSLYGRRFYQPISREVGASVSEGREEYWVVRE